MDEAQAALTALQRSRETAVARQQYYASRPFMNDGETAHVTLASAALDLQEAASRHRHDGERPRPHPRLQDRLADDDRGHLRRQLHHPGAARLLLVARRAGRTGHRARGAVGHARGFRRRADDWQFQADQAAREITGLDQQIAGAAVRLDNARTELANHDLQTANARETDAFLHGKYTAQELYDWTVDQVSELYFTAYQLAYDTAKRAEQAYRFELGVDTSSFVRFGYWDSLHKGLLAGERLAADLKRMEMSYLERTSGSTS